MSTADPMPTSTFPARSLPPLHELGWLIDGWDTGVEIGYTYDPKDGTISKPHLRMSKNGRALMTRLWGPRPNPTPVMVDTPLGSPQANALYVSGPQWTWSARYAHQGQAPWRHEDGISLLAQLAHQCAQDASAFERDSLKMYPPRAAPMIDATRVWRMEAMIGITALLVHHGAPLDDSDTAAWRAAFQAIDTLTQSCETILAGKNWTEVHKKGDPCDLAWRALYARALASLVAPPPTFRARLEREALLDQVDPSAPGAHRSTRRRSI